MTLQVWIEKESPKKIAKLLNVDISTVHYWKTAHSLPRAEVLVRIHKLSKNKVSYRSMIEAAAKKQKRSRKN